MRYACYISTESLRFIFILNKIIVDPSTEKNLKEYERRDTGDGVLELMLHPTFSEDD